MTFMPSTPLLLNPEISSLEHTNELQIPTIEPLFFEDENKEPPLKKLLNLCKENISKKILEEKQTDMPLLSLPALEDFLEKFQFDSEAPDQPTPQKKKKEESPFVTAEGSIPFLRPQLQLQEASSSISAISEESLLLFDKMCSEMLVMSSESCSKTTLTLQSKEFTHSPFYGAEITLEEFSTAPTIFNVSIKANESAIILIQSHLAGFMQLLEDRNFSFGINRIDTSIANEPFTSKKIKKNQDKFSPLGEDAKDERTT